MYSRSEIHPHPTSSESMLLNHPKSDRVDRCKVAALVCIINEVYSEGEGVFVYILSVEVRYPPFSTPK